MPILGTKLLLQTLHGRRRSRGSRANPGFRAHLRIHNSNAARDGRPQSAGSGRVAVVVIEHAAQSLAALDRAGCCEVGRIGADETV
jgi:hypothetical protein